MTGVDRPLIRRPRPLDSTPLRQQQPEIEKSVVVDGRCDAKCLSRE